MAKCIHVIDHDSRRRALVSRDLYAWDLHVEIYENVGEFLGVADRKGVVLAADDRSRGDRQLFQAIRCGLPVVVYAVSPSVEDVVEAMVVGARGYLMWPFDTGQLNATLRRLWDEEANNLPRDAVLNRARSNVKILSCREKEVLTQLIGGLSNKQIGEELEISPRTVEIHRANMMTKLSARSLGDAVRIGLYAGLDQYWGTTPLPRVA